MVGFIEEIKIWGKECGNWMFREGGGLVVGCGCFFVRVFRGRF